jgi:hypothetical protein
VPGIVIGTAGVAVGVVSEAIFVGLRVRPILKGPLRDAPAVATRLTWGGFLRFYVPLALTSMIMLASLPIGSAGMTRMPRALDSLATWPVINGMVFLFRGIGIAFNEVVVARLEEPGALAALRRFAWLLAASTSSGFLLIAATPASTFWLGTVSALPPSLVELGRSALWIGVFLPGVAFLQSLHAGILIHARVTRAVTESVMFSLTTIVAVLALGTVIGRFPGVHVALLGIVLGALAQVGWLMRRSRPLIAAHAVSDAPVGVPARPAV